MPECSSECCSIIDVHGLHALANLTANLRAAIVGRLESGALGVPTVVWQEFEDVYEEEAESLAPHVSRRINIGHKYKVGAASIADRLNSGFPDGAYNRNADLYTSAIAEIEGYTIVTSITSHGVPAYGVVECEVADIMDWAAAT